MKTSFEKNLRVHRSTVILFALLIVALVPTVLTNVAESSSDSCDMFGAAVNYAVGSYPFSVAVGDFNGDGKQDLATANDNSHNVTVLLGDGSGGFSPASGSPFAIGTRPRSVAVGDFNGDGKLDLTTANWGSSNVTVLLGDGSGGFGETSGSPFAVGSYPHSVAVGDFNGDGKQDLTTANQSSFNVTVLLGNGSGGFSEASGSPFAVGSAPNSAAVGDFNSDGKQDLTTANIFSSNVSVLLGNTCNSPPVANAGTDQTVVYAGASGTAVTVDGSASSDPDGDSLTFTWTGPFTEGGGTATGVSPTVTLPLGESTITLVVNDGAVDSPPDTVRVAVKYDFSGFFQPVDNLPTMNVAKAGSAIPLKWSLGGYKGMVIFAAGYPASGTIPCEVTPNADVIEETVTAGGSSLDYDAATGQYIYVWKTDKAWAGTCRQLVIMLNDGTFHRANFKFTR